MSLKILIFVSTMYTVKIRLIAPLETLILMQSNNPIFINLASALDVGVPTGCSTSA